MPPTRRTFPVHRVVHGLPLPAELDTVSGFLNAVHAEHARAPRTLGAPLVRVDDGELLVAYDTARVVRGIPDAVDDAEPAEPAEADQ